MVIFSAHGYGFSVRAIPKQRLLREGWDGERTKSKNGFPKSPAGGGVSGFYTQERVSAFLGGKGWEQRNCMSVLSLFYSVHSTAHGKPLVVDSSSYV